jgi:hypothetical protein
VHVRLKHNGTTFRTDALIDSGATGTFVPIEYAEILGIQIPEERIEAMGAGGTFPTYATKINEIDVLKGMRIFCKIKDMTIAVPANTDAIPHVILGRDSIFWCNDITFRERREHTIFRTPKREHKPTRPRIRE